MVKRENMDSTDLPDDLVHCPECAKPVKAKAIVIHFRRAHGRLPPGMHFLAFFGIFWHFLPFWLLSGCFAIFLAAFDLVL